MVSDAPGSHRAGQLMLSLLAAAALWAVFPLSAPAQGSGSVSVTDPRDRAMRGMEDTRFAQDTLESFRAAYERMGKPRITVEVKAEEAPPSTRRPLEDRVGAREVERAITRVFRLGGATLTDARARPMDESMMARRRGGEEERTSRELRVIVRVQETSIHLAVHEGEAPRPLVEVGSEGKSAPGATRSELAEALALEVLRELSARVR